MRSLATLFTFIPNRETIYCMLLRCSNQGTTYKSQHEKINKNQQKSKFVHQQNVQGIQKWQQLQVISLTFDYSFDYSDCSLKVLSSTNTTTTLYLH